MKHLHLFILIFAAVVSAAITGCVKESTLIDDGKFTTVKVYTGRTIQIPMEMVAGNGHLLSVYQVSDSAGYRFMMTDNIGNHLWTKDFGLNSVSGIVVTGMVAEQNNTFSIFNNNRRINIDVDGNILSDDPGFLSPLGNYLPMHIMINEKGNYLIYGKISFAIPNYAFACEITHDGMILFKKVYGLNTNFTGCQQTPDGGYLFLGSLYNGGSVSKFLICKTDSAGMTQWIKYHNAPGLTVNPSIYYNYSHDILPSGDGNYICFVGSGNPEISSASRVYKVSSDGNLLDSININFGSKNLFVGGNDIDNSFSGTPRINGYCAVRKSDGTFLAILNNGRPEQVIYGTSALKGTNAFSIRFDRELSVESIRSLQKTYPDYFSSVCITSDGKIATFGMVSSFGDYNKPIIIISE